MLYIFILKYFYALEKQKLGIDLVLLLWHIFYYIGMEIYLLWNKMY